MSSLLIETRMFNLMDVNFFSYCSALKIMILMENFVKKIMCESFCDVELLLFHFLKITSTLKLLK